MKTRFNAQNHTLQIIPDADTSAILELELSQTGLENLGQSTGGVQKTGIANSSRTSTLLYHTGLNEMYSVDLEFVEFDLAVVNALVELFNQSQRFTMVLADKTAQSNSKIEWKGCFIKESPKYNVTTAGANAFFVNFTVEYLDKVQKIS